MMTSKPTSRFRPALLTVVAMITLSTPLEAAQRTERARISARAFSLCPTGGGRNCVVDGDMAWIGGTKVRLADIDAPETHPSRCAREARLGNRATLRLAALLNAGLFIMTTTGRDIDRYGRKLRILSRNGASFGGILVKEGLARWYRGARRPWC